VIWDILYELGKMLVNDDINDFLPKGAAIPFDPNVGGPGHINGMIHHGAIGLALQTVAYMGGMADIAMKIAPSSELEDQLLSISQQWEQIAYPF